MKSSIKTRTCWQICEEAKLYFKLRKKFCLAIIKISKTLAIYSFVLHIVMLSGMFEPPSGPSDFGPGIVGGQQDGRLDRRKMEIKVAPAGVVGVAVRSNADLSSSETSAADEELEDVSGQDCKNVLIRLLDSCI